MSNTLKPLIDKIKTVLSEEPTNSELKDQLLDIYLIAKEELEDQGSDEVIERALSAMGDVEL